MTTMFYITSKNPTDPPILINLDHVAVLALSGIVLRDGTSLDMDPDYKPDLERKLFALVSTHGSSHMPTIIIGD